MSYRWVKHGQLYRPGAPEARHPKLATHAANPLPIHVDGNVYRVFYSGRDSEQRSSVGAVDVDIVSRKVIHEHEEPFLVHGDAGSFFSDGVSIGNCYEADGTTYMLFMGWQRPLSGHWRGDIGRIVVSGDLSLRVETHRPFLASDGVDPVSLSYPWVMRLSSNEYSMWYGSTISWDVGNGEMLHVINRATSQNGHDWQREGLAVPFRLGEAQAFSRPTVIQDIDGRLNMWFSYRGSGMKYRIGFAHSQDGITWRLDLGSSGIAPSQQGWDAEMIEYPFVLDHRGSRYMLYNGNDFGRSGFGIAEWLKG